MDIAAKVLVLRATFAVRRADRRRRQQLERELAAYSSPSDRLEIEAILDRYPPGQTCELREILAQQSLQRLHRTTGLNAASAA